MKTSKKTNNKQQTTAPTPEPMIELTAEEKAFVAAWQAEEKAAYELSYAKRMLESRIDTAKERIARFQVELAKNPAWALEWSASDFTAAAVIEVAGYALRMLNNEAPLSAVIADLLQKAMRTYGTSTSAASNLMEHERQQTAVRLYQDLVRS